MKTSYIKSYLENQHPPCPKRPTLCSEQGKPLPDWEEVRKELRKKGVTLNLIWIEYIEKHPDGYKHAQFGEYYRRWKKTYGEPSMHNTHVGGEPRVVCGANACRWIMPV